MEFHEYSKYFPLLEGEDYDALVADIKQNGLLEPIVLYEEKILDGRNRWRACQDAGIKPRFRHYEGESALSFVVSMNVRRRHLTIGQLSFIALDMLPAFEAEARKKLSTALPGGERRTFPEEIPPHADRAVQARDQVGDALGISGRTVSAAKRIDKAIETGSKDIKKAAKKLKQEVVEGRLGVQSAEAEIRRREEQERREGAREKQATYDASDEVKWILEYLTAWTKKVDDFKSTFALGKFSPEARQFAARKFRKLAEKLIEFAKELER